MWGSSRVASQGRIHAAVVSFQCVVWAIRGPLRNVRPAVETLGFSPAKWRRPHNRLSPGNHGIRSSGLKPLSPTYSLRTPETVPSRVPGTFRGHRMFLAGLLFFALPAAAQLPGGRQPQSEPYRDRSVGYSDNWGSDINSNHSLNAGGNGTLSGFYYNPNFLSISTSHRTTTNPQQLPVPLPLRQQRRRVFEQHLWRAVIFRDRSALPKPGTIKGISEFRECRTTQLAATVRALVSAGGPFCQICPA